jgi:hypothetical protein
VEGLEPGSSSSSGGGDPKWKLDLEKKD